jgi:plastocyanin
MGESMRKALVILIVLFGVFLAIGCAGKEGGTPNQTVTPPANEATPAEKPVTPAEAVTPAVEPQPAGKGKIVEVAIKNFAFEPASVNISTGDTLRWTNMDSDIHTVRGPTFESGNLEKGDTFEFLFTDPGVYNYNCSIHPSMKGTVTVTEKK